MSGGKADAGLGPRERVYAFHVDGSPNGTLDDWKHFDWSQITTLSLYGRLSPALLCHAHAHNVRVVLGDGGTGTDFSQAAVDAWIKNSVEKLRSTFADGLNIDLEISNCSVRKQHQQTLRILCPSSRPNDAFGAQHIGNCDNPSGWSTPAMANLTRAVSRATAALHAAVPGSHVSLCTASLGLFEEGAGGRGCGWMCEWRNCRKRLRPAEFI